MVSGDSDKRLFQRDVREPGHAGPCELRQGAWLLLHGRKWLEGVSRKTDGTRFIYFLEAHSGCSLENWLYGSKGGINIALSPMRGNGSLDQSGNSKHGTKLLNSSCIWKVEFFRDPKANFKFVVSLQGLTRLQIHLILMVRFNTSKEKGKKQQEKVCIGQNLERLNAGFKVLSHLGTHRTFFLSSSEPRGQVWNLLVQENPFESLGTRLLLRIGHISTSC